MASSDTLLILPSLRAAPGSHGSFVLTRKFLDGVLEYVNYWPGRVAVAMQRSSNRDDNLDHVEVHPDDLPFALQWFDPQSEQAASVFENADVALVTLVDKHTRLGPHAASHGVPLIYITEYTLATRRQIARAATANPALRWRRDLYNLGVERRYERALRQAAGVQCNGLPTYNAYRSINFDPLLYFDTRVRANQLASYQDVQARTADMLAGRPLRLAFSGRLIAMKGTNHLPRVAKELRKRHVPFTMDICGAGVLEGSIRDSIAREGLSDQVRLRGVLDFKAELVPFTTRQVDLFVCCHVQGDPSCTYLETMSCGTPIAGYANEAFAGLTERAGVGFVTPMGRPALLARAIERLHHDRSALAQAAHDSLSFAGNHTFERTMQARVAHMRAHCRFVSVPATEPGTHATLSQAGA